MKFSRILFALILLNVVTVRADSVPEGALLYSGLTPSGWQICLLDLASGKTRQLTNSAGDKRRPFYLQETGTVVYKDSSGRAIGWKSDHEKVLSGKTLPMGDVWVSANAHDCYFTRLATDNPQRQFIWKHTVANAEEEPQLVLRMNRGSLRQVVLSPDGRMAAATHLWRVGEERILVFPLATPEKYQHVSPEMKTAFSPSWSKDGKSVFFSMQQEGGKKDYDLYRVRVEGGETQCLLQSAETSEWFPSSDASENWLFYEENRTGRSLLAALELKTGKILRFDLPHQAREPHWIPALKP